MGSYDHQGVPLDGCFSSNKKGAREGWVVGSYRLSFLSVLYGIWIFFLFFGVLPVGSL